MKTIAATLAYARHRLALVSDVAALEAECLLAHVLVKPRSYLYAWPETLLTSQQSNSYDSYIQRRLKREPLAYLTGKREFWSLELGVTNDTLIPRPETEELVAWIIKQYSAQQMITVADLGTGSGAIAIALAYERPDWCIHATDKSAAALAQAQHNANACGASITFYQGDWCAALPHHDYDVIVSNPPYLSAADWQDSLHALMFEPKGALLSGQDGLCDLSKICHSAPCYLKPNGYLIVEHGFSQGKIVRALMQSVGLRQVNTLTDLSGKDRVTVGEK